MTQKPCDLWTGAVGAGGYGNTKLNGKYINAHVKAYVENYGPVPDGMVVMHSCDVRLCREPTHLSVGTQHDNLVDAARKDRMNKKLTIAQIKDIHRLYTGKRGQQTALAKQFGVSANMVNKIVNGSRRQYADYS